MANVAYRHSGGNERRTETERGVAGTKRPKGRANAVFIDTHIELRRSASNRVFSLELD